MDAGIRRQEILDRLAATRRPLAATRLGAQLGVSRQVIVGDDDPGVGPHLQGATHPVLSILRPHGQGDDLAVGLLGQTDSGLDGVLVELVEDVLLPAHEATVLDATLGLDVRNVLDADHDSHGLKVAITAASRH